jgi:hypothetical protein
MAKTKKRKTKKKNTRNIGLEIGLIFLIIMLIFGIFDSGSIGEFINNTFLITFGILGYFVMLMII